MRSMGEQRYRDWHVERLEETSITLYLACLLGQTALIGAVGVAVIYFTHWERQTALLAIGLGIVAYAIAVGFYSMLGVWRLRRLQFRQNGSAAGIKPGDFSQAFPPRAPEA